MVQREIVRLDPRTMRREPNRALPANPHGALLYITSR